MTAAEAKTAADTALEGEDTIQRTSIDETIALHASLGKYSCSVGRISKAVEQELLDDGFIVRVHYDPRDGITTIISWEIVVP